MVPNMCKIPTKPWFLGGANIRGLPNTIRYTTKYHPNTKNYSRCLLLGGLVLREGILWQEYDGFFEGTLNYQSSWEIYLTTQIYDKSRFSRHRWTKKEKEITETPIIWRFPVMGVPPNHQVIRPWLSIFKQPWWLGIPHDVRTPIFSQYSPSFTKFGYVFFHPAFWLIALVAASYGLPVFGLIALVCGVVGICARSVFNFRLHRKIAGSAPWMLRERAGVLIQLAWKNHRIPQKKLGLQTY